MDIRLRSFYYFALSLLLGITATIAASPPQKPLEDEECKDSSDVFIPKSFGAAKEDAAVEAEIYRICKLNPEGGLGGIGARSTYNYYAFENIEFLKENWEEFEPWWNERYGNLTDTEDKRLNHFFDSLEIAKAISEFGGPDAIVNFRNRQDAKAMGAIAVSNQKALNDAALSHQKELLLANWEWWDKFFKIAPKCFQELILTKQMALFVLAAIATMLFFHHALKPLFQYLWRHLFAPPPKIVQKTTLPLTWWEWLKRKNPLPKSRWQELKYDESVQLYFADDMACDKKIVQESLNLEFENVILEGPPGTGKTALAENYAYEAGMDYMFIPGARWAQLETAEKLYTFYQVLDVLKAAKKPVLVFIDEIDAVFMKRKDATDDTRKLISAFLESISAPSNAKIKWVGATNLVEDLDPAILSRFAKRKHIGNPGPKIAQVLFQDYLRRETDRHEIRVTSLPRVGTKLAAQNLNGRALEAFAKRATKKWLFAGVEEVDKEQIKQALELEWPCLKEAKDLKAPELAPQEVVIELENLDKALPVVIKKENAPNTQKPSQKEVNFQDLTLGIGTLIVAILGLVGLVGLVWYIKHKK